MALLSVGLLGLDYLEKFNSDTKVLINRFDLIVAIVFLLDFTVKFIVSRSKKLYLKRDWYLLLASIPVVDSWAEALRALRLFELFRLVRAGEHISFVSKSLTRK